MQNYTAHLALRSFNNPFWYHISVCPSTYSGSVPYRDYKTYDEFAAALIRLGVAPEAVPHVVRELERDKTRSLLSLPLSDEIAAEFGWPPV
ncbi:MAG: hypothetical protein JWQ49_6697 [Edaphobacter sp.]|nr:hypothetical protein [Edaphobacter sp.]